MVDREEFYQSYKGHKHGWYFCRDGQRLARLDYQGHSDMFWLSFRVTPLGEEPSAGSSVVAAMIAGDEGDTYENQRLELTVPERDFLVTDRGDGEIVLRDCRGVRAEPTWLERAFFLFRRLFNRKGTS